MFDITVPHSIQKTGVIDELDENWIHALV
jgi:hypothetical protein